MPRVTQLRGGGLGVRQWVVPQNPRAWAAGEAELWGPGLSKSLLCGFSYWCGFHQGTFRPPANALGFCAKHSMPVLAGARGDADILSPHPRNSAVSEQTLGRPRASGKRRQVGSNPRLSVTAGWVWASTAFSESPPGL